MDVFVEQIVKRRRTTGDIFKIALCVLAILLVLLAAPMLLSIQFLGSIALLICVGLIYLLYNVLISVNLEYEYAFTNGALDVDKIIAARRRKKLADLNAREIEIMAKTSNRAYKNYAESRDITKIYACTSPSDDDVFFVVYLKESKKYMLLFNPDERIQDGFRRLNPQNVFLD